MWNESGRPHDQLLSAAAIKEAKQWISKHPKLCNEIDKFFFDESQKTVKKTKDKRNRQVIWALSIVIVLLIIIGGIMSKLYVNAEKESERAKSESERSRELLMINEAERLKEIDPTKAAIVHREVENPAQFKYWLSRGLQLMQQPLYQSILQHDGYVISATISPDGSKIVTASCDQTEKVWSIEGKLLSTLKHNHWVNSATFSSAWRTLIMA